MTIPIVQGTEVPNGGYQAPTDHYNPYVGAADDGRIGDPAHNNSPATDEKPRQFQDLPWAALFVVHLVVIVAVCSVNLSMNDDGDGASGASAGVVWFVGVTAVVSIGISCASLSFMMQYPKALVKMALLFSISMSLVMAVLGFISGQTWMALLCLLMFVIGICYARMVWPRIPFAASTLHTALTAVKANMGLTFVAIVMLGIALAWSLLWFLGLSEAASTQNAGILFLLLVSYYWVHQVLSNVVHVTSAGTVATWWYVPLEANSCWSSALQNSFFRATTYSFGSICFGSLLVAVVQALRAMAHMARENGDNQLLLCLIECILSMIQGIIEYLNKWAYVYVGIYGFNYLEAGKNVIQLFENKGWTVIINDDLCDRVLFMVSAGVGLLTGGVGWALGAADPNLLADLNLQVSTAGVGFLIGMIVGFVFSSILLSVVGSAVNTVIVCFAEAPAEFQNNHPQLSAQMRNDWAQAWPGLLN